MMLIMIKSRSKFLHLCLYKYAITPNVKGSILGKA